MDVVWPYLAALVPTIFVATFFYVIMKRIIEGDRNERLAQRRFEEAQDAAENAAEKTRESADPDNRERPAG
ncbi:hypothetical protein [Phycicoccus duodecadis]|uniref:Uncharacterized protein n=1 Tax=Phycicoccus duodecadis TaxID=173053 RepID=A0A2N3YM41_9MICO|nr:hypothetical protein [Phycicoccus duodecadis]PKW27904.1 hypothetical protein ATL31_2755 [Phycicoccus duodecadis]